MKRNKLLSILLVLVMCVSLCACGGDNKTQVSSDSEEKTDNEQKVLHLNEKITIGDLEFAIIDVRFKDSEGYSVNYSTGGRHYGGPSVVLTYSLKNIGKSNLTPPGNMLQLNYADGYTFLCDVYINGNNPNIFENGGVNSTEELEVLSSERYYMEAFTVPEEVFNNSEEPLYITLAGAEDTEKSAFRFNIRPIDEINVEAYYQQAIDLMDEQRYDFAIENLMLIQENKNVDNLLLEACVKSYSGYKYLSENKEDFRVLSGDELENMLIGTWEKSDGETWIFYEDGTLDTGRTKISDGTKVIIDWSIKDNELVLGYPIDTKIAIREVYNGAIITFNEDGNFYTSMWKK